MANPVASNLTAVDVAPDSIESLWALPFLMAADWNGGFQLTHTHRTDVGNARTMSERRIGVTAKPSRILRFSLAPGAASAVVNVLEYARRQAASRSLVPLYCDGADTTAPTSGASVPFGTALLRYPVGTRVAIATPYSGGSNVFPAFEIGQVAAVAGDSITLTAPLSRTYPTRSRVYPLMECDVVADWSATLSNRSAGSGSFSCREVTGVSAFPPLLAYDASAPVPTFDGTPVWSPPVGWTLGGPSIGYHMDVQSVAVGTGVVNVPLGARPRWTVAGSSLLSGRAAAFDQLGFFDWCAGRLRSFLCVAPTDAYRVQAVRDNSLLVDAAGPVSAWRSITHVAAVARDGTPSVARVLAAVRTGGVDRLTLDRPLGVAKQDVARLAPAFLGRFDTDEFTEDWATTSLASVAWRVTEVLEEKHVEVG